MSARLALLLVICGCGDRVGGVQVQLLVHGHAPPDGPTAMTSAAVHVVRAELFECATARWWRWLSPVGVAHAHGSDAVDPRVWEGDVEADLLGGVRRVATLQPPPGSYCAVRLAVRELALAGTHHGQPWASSTPAQRIFNAALPAVVLDGDHPVLHLTWPMALAPAMAGADPTGEGLAETVLGRLPAAPVITTPQGVDT